MHIFRSITSIVVEINDKWHFILSILKFLWEKSKVRKRSFSDLKFILFYRNLNKLSMKCHSYPKSATIDVFEQKICPNPYNTFATDTEHVCDSVTGARDSVTCHLRHVTRIFFLSFDEFPNEKQILFAC